MCLLSSISIAGINEDNFANVRKKFPEKWFTCTVSEECMILPSHCGIPIAINKSYEKEHYGFLFNKKKELRSCIDFVSPKWPSRVLCESNRCVYKH